MMHLAGWGEAVMQKLDSSLDSGSSRWHLQRPGRVWENGTEVPSNRAVMQLKKTKWRRVVVEDKHDIIDRICQQMVFKISALGKNTIWLEKWIEKKVMMLNVDDLISLLTDCLGD